MICENCVQGFVLDGEPQGKLVDGHYFHPAPTGSPSKAAIVIFTDIYGLPLNNPKILADFYSKTLNVDVWVPDLFAGKPCVGIEDLEPLVPVQPGERQPLSTKLKFVGVLATKGWGLWNHRPAVGISRVTPFLEQKRKEYESIGAIGFCYGGGLAIHFGGTDLIDTVIIAHPGGLTDHHTICKIKIPNCWLMAEEDFSFSRTARNAAEAEMKMRKGKKGEVEYVFYDYEGTTHGFAARPATQHPKVKAGFEKSLNDTIQWFYKTLLKGEGEAPVASLAAPHAKAEVTSSTTEQPAPTAVVAAPAAAADE